MKYIDYAADLIEIIGVVVIVVSMVLALVRYLASRKKDGDRAYRELRQGLGRGILLGLEILVAGDIISTVANKSSMDSVLTLGLIVLIRTFLSLSIETEIEGRFPWQRGKKEAQE